MQSDRTPSALPRWFFPAMALNATVGAVWGYTAVTCGGVIAGMGSTLVAFCLFAFVQPAWGMALLLILACSGVSGLALARHRLFRERQELLFFLMPVASLLLGAAWAASGAVPPSCPSLGPWR